MRNPAPSNHFPPTLFSPNRSPIYGGAHLFSQPGSRLVTGNCSLQKEVNRRLEFELGAWFDGFCGFALVLALSQILEHGPLYRVDNRRLALSGVQKTDYLVVSGDGPVRQGFSARRRIIKKMFETH